MTVVTSMSFPSPFLKGVRGFAVLREVEAEKFFVFLHAKRNEQVHDFEDYVGADARPAPRSADRRQLNQDLLRIAVKETVGGGRVDRDGCEEPGGEGAPGATDAVHRPDVERIVDVDPLAQLNRPVAEHTPAETDLDRAPY